MQVRDQLSLWSRSNSNADPLYLPLLSPLSFYYQQQNGELTNWMDTYLHHNQTGRVHDTHREETKY